MPDVSAVLDDLVTRSTVFMDNKVKKNAYIIR